MNSDRIQWLEKYAAEDPSDPFPRYALALEWADSDSGKALNLLRQLMADHPGYLPVYYQTARLFVSTGKLSEARAILEKGIPLAKAADDHKTMGEMRGLMEEIE